MKKIVRNREFVFSLGSNVMSLIFVLVFEIPLFFKENYSYFFFDAKKNYCAEIICSGYSSMLCTVKFTKVKG